MSDIGDLVEVMARLDRRKQIYQLEYYQPYPFQVAFHNAEGYLTPGRPAQQKMLIAANKVGKTHCAAMEVAIHATGKYPDWWMGTRFLYPPEILVSGLTNDSVRDLGQRELLGDPTDEKKLGTGTIPIDTIGKRRTKTGVPNAYDSVRIAHTSGGWSRIYFRAYEQGWKKFQGIAFELAWPDEEPPQDIFSQLIRSTLARKNAMIMLTMTPEQGMTQVVTGFLNNLQRGQAVVNATWDDAPHLTTEIKQQRLMAFPEHEREMRSKGTPLQGAGLVFRCPDEQIKVEPFDIPRHWPQIVGIDFGWDHPFAAVRMAWDRDNDIEYLISEYRESRALPPIHVAAIMPWGDWIPVAWPHDGLEARDGIEFIAQYRRLKLNVLPWKATHPPAPGEKEGEGGISVEAGLMQMLERMETGRFKVFSTCKCWLEEKRMYHRDEKAKLVKLNDDLLCLHPDTQVITYHGSKRIADLVGTTGKLLSVNRRWEEYRDCRKTQENAEIVEVIFDDGSSVKCTPNHKFLTLGGWIPAIDLEGNYCHNAVSPSIYTGPLCESPISPKKLRPLTGLNIPTSETLNISEETGDFYIGRYGNFTTEKSQRDTMFTTKTVTGPTIRSKILSVLKDGFISLNTIWAINGVQQQHSKSWSDGERLQRVLNTRMKWARKIITSCALLRNLFASVAVRSFVLRTLASIGFAPIFARANGEGTQDSMMCNGLACNAELYSRQINTQETNFVQSLAQEKTGLQRQKARNTLRVLQVRSAGRSDVYCLEVPSTQAFAVASGAIVHNCASRYSHMMLRHARTKSVLPSRRQSQAVGMSTWA